MAKWSVVVDVIKARGTQEYEIEAESLEEAKEIWKRGDGKCVSEELEAIEIGEPKFIKEAP